MWRMNAVWWDCVYPQPYNGTALIFLKWNLGWWGFLHTNLVMGTVLPKHVRARFQSCVKTTKLLIKELQAWPLERTYTPAWASVGSVLIPFGMCVHTYTFIILWHLKPEVSCGGNHNQDWMILQGTVRRPGHQPWLYYQPVLAEIRLQILNEGLGLDHLQGSFLRIKKTLSTEKVVTKFPHLISRLSSGTAGQQCPLPSGVWIVSEIMPT